MHIPDGFLSVPVLGIMDAVAFPSIAYLARRARQREFDHHRIPLMGVMGAFVFAAQMINFPVGNGTSGHLVGGALLAFTLGPASAAVVLTAILATQALVFQDGGIAVALRRQRVQHRRSRECWPAICRLCAAARRQEDRRVSGRECFPCW